MWWEHAGDEVLSYSGQFHILLTVKWRCLKCTWKRTGWFRRLAAGKSFWAVGGCSEVRVLGQSVARLRRPGCLLLPPESRLVCQGQDALCWLRHEADLVGLLFWQPTRLSPRCSQRKHQFSELFLMQHTLFCPLSRVRASLTLLLESHLFNLFWYKKK